MKRNKTLGLIMFGIFTTLFLFVGAHILIVSGTNVNANEGEYLSNETKDINEDSTKEKSFVNENVRQHQILDLGIEEPWLASNPSEPFYPSQDIKGSVNYPIDRINREFTLINPDGTLNNVYAYGNRDRNKTNEEDQVQNSDSKPVVNTIGNVVSYESDVQLIYDSWSVDYRSYIPNIVTDTAINKALDVPIPKLKVAASSVVLINTKTKDIIYHKNALEPVFPASTIKLLTALIALEWCEEEDVITVGEEVKLMASDSTRANLRAGQILTMRSLLEGMLLPSGNDAAYVIAVHVGRKSLQDPEAPVKEAWREFRRLMNTKARDLGAKNSIFLTPDGYDAIGQYTTAYDMAMIGVAAAQNKTIVEISMMPSARARFISGEDKTWRNTNALIRSDHFRYYPNAIGLKTGTTTMAGRCLIAAGRKNGKEVVAVIMNSTSEGRWNDAVTLLDYGLK